MQVVIVKMVRKMMMMPCVIGESEGDTCAVCVSIKRRLIPVQDYITKLTYKIPVHIQYNNKDAIIC